MINLLEGATYMLATNDPATSLSWLCSNINLTVPLHVVDGCVYDPSILPAAGTWDCVLDDSDIAESLNSMKEPATVILVGLYSLPLTTCNPTDWRTAMDIENRASCLNNGLGGERLLEY
eukprot:Protomagalhaensia_sp_Gyna_25__5212@NODE_629_length_2967_cov_192_706967_g488_i0_p5_GENE_NODE_629_length_2967_cov_192_706967_g488_i0NODE_629_length_2967_cov_192_706967_g488_i0_p5_ORF_typecomplete_len119_score11_66_NODE_629_length_2967_cov_192_706967_g488_i016882044